MKKQTVGDRIKELRIEKALSLRELSEAIGVSAPTLQRYENGVIKNISPDMVSRIAQELGTTAGWLLGENKAQSSGQTLYALSPKDRYILDAYHNLPENLRELVYSLFCEVNNLHMRVCNLQSDLELAEEFIGSAGYESEYQSEKKANARD